MFIIVLKSTHLDAKYYYITIADVSTAIYAALTRLSEKLKPYFSFFLLYFVYPHSDKQPHGGWL
jgi:hypothetical protein